MNKIREYTCTRRMNKQGTKIWVVLEDGRKFYRIFPTQAEAIAYFQPLKTTAQMKVQQANGDKFSKIVFTLEAMNKKGMKNSSKNITHQIVKDSDKFFDEKELKSKVISKENSSPIIEKVVKPKSIAKPIIKKVPKPKPTILKSSIEKNDLILELKKLDESKIEEFEKKDTINITIIDEILSRKSLAEKSWNEDLDVEPDNEKIENTIYVQEEIVKPLIINSQKINLNDNSSIETATIEDIIDQRTQEINTKSVDYGRIKEYDDYEKTQINNDSLKSDELNNNEFDETNYPKSMSNVKFWFLIIWFSILIMLIVAMIILFVMAKK